MPRLRYSFVEYVQYSPHSRLAGASDHPAIAHRQFSDGTLAITILERCQAVFYFFGYRFYIFYIIRYQRIYTFIIMAMFRRCLVMVIIFGMVIFSFVVYMFFNWSKFDAFSRRYFRGDRGIPLSGMKLFLREP